MKVHLPGHNGYPACGAKVPGKKVPEPASLDDVTCGSCKRSIRYESRERQAGFEKIEAARAAAAATEPAEKAEARKIFLAGFAAGMDEGGMTGEEEFDYWWGIEHPVKEG